MTPVPSELLHALKSGDSFLITSHIKPDGDAIGSMAALGHILVRLGKNFSLFNESGLPEKFTWLEIPGIINKRPPEGDFDWIIVLDSGNADRPGKYISDLMNRKPCINIDHHPGNTSFGRINWVDPEYPAVGEMIALIAEELGLELTGPIAESIYLAVVSDTGFFSFGNTTPGVLELSATLIRNGLDVRNLNPLITNQWSRARIQLHGLALQKAEFIDEIGVGLMCITRNMLKKTGTGPEDSEGLVNMLLKVHGVRVAVIMREDEPGRVKLSLRSAGDDDVRVIAADLNGGGHKNASGAVVEASMREAREMIIGSCRRHLG